VSTKTWRIAACAAGFVVGVSSVSPALAEETSSPEVAGLPAVLTADLSAAEERTLTAKTSGEGIPVAAFVSTPHGPEVVTLDADSRTDAAAAVSLLKAQPSVEAAEVPVAVRAVGGMYSQYGNTMIRSQAARAGVDNPLSDVVVAVLDTGVSAHPELVSALLPGRNFTDSPGGATDATDRAGHGTHVAGTIAADAGSGVEGVAYDAKILPIKVLGDSGSGWSDWIANGIVWAADNGADVINMSLGGASSSTVQTSALAYARSKGVTVIAAAGNDNNSLPHYPAADAGVIAVSAVDSLQQKASFSNYGSYVDIAAPGVNIASTYLDGGFVGMNGTSMATPHVAGVAALIKGAAPSLTPDQVEQALIASVTDLGTPGRDDIFGAGLVDAQRAVSAANALESPGPVQPVVAPVTAPDAPVMGTPNLGNTAVRVRWAPPASQGSTPVTGYTVRAYRGATLLSTTPMAASATDLLVSGLPNGTAHTFTVTATNAAGAGPAASVTATPRTVPGATRIGTATPAARSAVVRWAAPLSNGGSPVTGYSLRVYRSTTLVTSVPVAGNATSATVTGLTNGVAYNFVLFARNAAGYGPGSARSAVVVPRTVPLAPRVTGVGAGRSSASVSWVAPGNGGTAITAYVVRVYRGSALVQQVRVSAGTTRLTVPRLRAGAGHTFAVYATNAAGTGGISARSATVVPRR
jgi:subtilisin family serine protease